MYSKINLERFIELGGKQDELQNAYDLLNNVINYLEVSDNHNNKITLGKCLMNQLEDLDNRVELKKFLTGESGRDVNLISNMYHYRKINDELTVEINKSGNSDEIVDGLLNSGLKIIRVIDNDEINLYNVELVSFLNRLYDELKAEHEFLSNNGSKFFDNITNVDIIVENINRLYLCGNCNMYYRKYQNMMSTIMNDFVCCPHCLVEKNVNSLKLEYVKDENIYEYLEDFPDCKRETDINKVRNALRELEATAIELKEKKKIKESLTSQFKVNEMLSRGVIDDIVKEGEK